MAAEPREVVTLKDVAAAAGVSVSTASRVLDSKSLRSPHASRIREIADELGYRRNRAASALRRGETGTIGVLVPRLSDAVMALMYESIAAACERSGRFAIVATAGDTDGGEAAAAETLLARGVDGLLLASARISDPLVASLRTRGVRHALVLRSDGVSPASLGDDDTGGYLAARHLVDLGHRDIALVTGPLYTSSARDRLAGAQRALAEAGVAPLIAETTDYRIPSGEQAAAGWLSGSRRPSAVFAANDDLAIGVLAASHRAGLEAGRDYSLVGYNDIPVAARLPVPLSSVRTNFAQIAASALELLDGGAEREVRLAMPTLMPRGSSVRA
ncbi:LacI family DNA-binding transcriptional regulator [Agrococcus sp. SL85]|uniref:LacI family DNA-binding transcriptional regulator n=1 Tax=Agrococcus sp. SL85 TaxID=2995141 RepID=UPI00226CD4FD|nr:LacI family DNA-binding transcriptional regulator [Agrococcus sp. SL85]WAC66851.1 LacI family DNA-binding transcriptional regulator [Agrococcus sp. SL85]